MRVALAKLHGRAWLTSIPPCKEDVLRLSNNDRRDLIAGRRSSNSLEIGAGIVGTHELDALIQRSGTEQLGTIPDTKVPSWSPRKALIKHALFLIVVVTPTLLSAVYYGLIASDVYVSESRFIIRAAQRQGGGGGISALLQGTGLPGFQRSVEDAYAVNDFVFSRDALVELESAVGLRAAFSDAEIDRLSRFPGLDLDDSFEALHLYYQRRIELNLDTSSSIATLRARAFKADDAYRINAVLLDAAERLVNQLNDRARKDLIRFAADEVTAAEARAKDASLAVSRFRTQRGVVDPERQTMIQLQQVSKLQDELVAAKTQIAQLKAFAPENSQLSALQLRVKTLQGEMDAELGKVAGGAQSLTTKAADFQRIALEREFAERQLAGALTSLEQARNEAQRTQLYLERIVQPSKPDVAMEPRRVRAVLTVLLLSLVAWGIAALLVASVREHVD